MHRILNPSTRLAASAAMALSVVLAVGGVLQLTDTPSGETTIVGVEHVIIGALTLTTLLLVPVVAHLARLAGRPRIVAAGTTGLVALAVLTTTSNVRGEDLGIFPAVAIPANLLILGALAGVAIGLRRQGRISLALAIALPFSWILALPFSNLGGGIAAGAIWLLAGWMLRHGELPRAAGRPVAVAAARS